MSTHSASMASTASAASGERHERSVRPARAPARLESSALAVPDEAGGSRIGVAGRGSAWLWVTRAAGGRLVGGPAGSSAAASQLRYETVELVGHRARAHEEQALGA